MSVLIPIWSCASSWARARSDDVPPPAAIAARAAPLASTGTAAAAPDRFRSARRSSRDAERLGDCLRFWSAI